MLVRSSKPTCKQTYLQAGATPPEAQDDPHPKQLIAANQTRTRRTLEFPMQQQFGYFSRCLEAECLKRGISIGGDSATMIKLADSLPEDELRSMCTVQTADGWYSAVSFWGSFPSVNMLSCRELAEILGACKSPAVGFGTNDHFVITSYLACMLLLAGAARRRPLQVAPKPRPPVRQLRAALQGSVGHHL